jgi:quercetin dioxygenase-like cupin family protein
MPLNLAPAQRKLTHRPFKSAGEHSVLMEADGQMTNTTLLFHATADQTNNYCTITEIRWTQEDHALHHIHRFEDEGFYVIEGFLTIHTEHGDISVTPGEIAWGPRNNRHAYSVPPGGARCLLIQTPGTDLTSFFKGASKIGTALDDPAAAEEFLTWSMEEFGVQFLDPTAYPPGRSVVDGGHDQTPGGGSLELPVPADVTSNRIFKSNGERRARSRFGADPENGPEWIFHMTGRQTGGAVGLIEIIWGPHEVMPFHSHSMEECAFYVIDGALDLILEDRELNLAPGELGWIPRGTRHAHRVGPEGARVLVSYYPGTSLDRMFELTAPMDNLTTDPANLAQWAAWAEETFGMSMELPAHSVAAHSGRAGGPA